MTKGRTRLLGWLVILCAVCFTIIIGDHLVGLYRDWITPTVPNIGFRAVRLREWEPRLTRYIRPTQLFGMPRGPIPGTNGLIDKEYLLRTDEDGFILPSRIHASPDWSIVFLGGSTTECLFMDEMKRFPYLVGRLLEKDTGKKINSFNGGRSGNTSLHSDINLLAKVVPMHPDAVVIMESINDLTTLMFEESYWNRNSSRSVVLTVPPEDHRWYYYVLKGFKNLFIKHLYDEAVWFVRSQGPPPDEFEGFRHQISFAEPNASEILSAFRNNLELFVYICKLHNIVPVLMTQQNQLTAAPAEPISGTLKVYEKFGITYPEFKAMYDRLNNVVRTVGKDHGLVVVDLAARIPPTWDYLYDVVHLTERGSAEAASIIATELRDSVPPGRDGGQ